MLPAVMLTAGIGPAQEDMFHSHFWAAHRLASGNPGLILGTGRQRTVCVQLCCASDPHRATFVIIAIEGNRIEERCQGCAVQRVRLQSMVFEIRSQRKRFMGLHYFPHRQCPREAAIHGADNCPSRHSISRAARVSGRAGTEAIVVVCMHRAANSPGRRSLQHSYA